MRTRRRIILYSLYSDGETSSFNIRHIRFDSVPAVARFNQI